jgi:hypothetical protein
LHISSHTLTYESEDLKTPLVKMKFDEKSTINFYHFEDLVKLYQILSGDINSQKDPPEKEKGFWAGKKQKKNVKNQLDDSKTKQKDLNENKTPAIIKIKDFELVLNEVMNGVTNSNNNNNNNNPNNNQIQQQLSNNILNTYASLDNSTIKNKNKKNLNNNINNVNNNFKELQLVNSQYSDLISYLNENNVNSLMFSELFHNINKTYQLSGNETLDKFQERYVAILIKTQITVQIQRENICRYSESENSKTFLFILDGNEADIKCFVDDVIVFYEGLSNHEEISLINIVTERKLGELKEKFEMKQSSSVRESNVINENNNNNNINTNSNTTGNNQGNIIPESSSKITGYKYLSNNTLNNIAINEKLRNKNVIEIKVKENNNVNKIIFTSSANRIMPEHYQTGLFIINANERTDINSNNTVNINFSKYYDAICEFLPVNNNYSKKSFKFSVSDIKAILTYRFLYNFKGLNIIFYNKKRSKLIDFETEENFKFVYDFMMNNCPKLDKSFTDIRYHTNMWVDGLLSNYDYLMYLNFMGGRSFEDLSQYPIMPWVLTNYEDQETLDLNDSKNFRDLSKPIGALNPKRLKKLKENYEELKEQGKEFPFLYGTYYSFPSIIFYYLVRSHPNYFLRFQGGNFGPTDRLFFSIKECWNSSYNNPSSQDVKELIPEFYNSDGDFMKNLLDLNLGKTQNDLTVDDVIFPKWAKSPKNFITIMRQALECEIVSNKLHLWIDLVFGYKQRGEKAIEADNLFHYLRYDDKLHLIIDKSDEEKQGEIVNIIEYGQIPIQLFNDPHPKKRSRLNINEIVLDANANQSEYFKVAKLKKERLNIEKKYEKERRQKDIEIEEVERKKQEKEKEYEDDIFKMNEYFDIIN